jgi:dihydrofolate reductase/thymidylate synthase
MFNIILACDKNGGISKNGEIPWNIPEDLHYFKKMTTSEFYNNVVIMGYNTWISIGKVLPNRVNVIITRKSNLENHNLNLFFINDFDKALEKFKNNKIWVIGGKQIYNIALIHPQLNDIYITKINYDFNCDNLIKLPKEQIISESQIFINNYHNLEFQFVIFKPIFNVEYQYLQLCKNILLNGEEKNGRNGKIKSIFGSNIEFNLQDGFPLLTTKKMFLRGIIEELLFFIRGETNSKLLENKKINIWKGNTSKEFLNKLGLNYLEGEMGPMYGYQWRSFNGDYPNKNGFDQLKFLIDEIKINPQSRRLIMTDFNPLQAQLGVLYPCHSLIIHFNVVENFIDCIMYQRSADTFLGLPFNIASTSLLLILIAKLVNKIPRKVLLSIGDTHIYEEHYKVMEEQLLREPFELPKLEIIKEINTLEDIEKLSFEDFQLINYNCHQQLKAIMKE